MGVPRRVVVAIFIFPAITLVAYVSETAVAVSAAQLFLPKGYTYWGERA
jgi:hypothetical protein